MNAKKRILITLITAIFAAGLAANCKKEPKDDTMMLLGLVYLITPKHTATVTRNVQNTNYSAVISGYAPAALPTSDAEAQQARIDYLLTTLGTIYQNHSECNIMNTTRVSTILNAYRSSPITGGVYNNKKLIPVANGVAEAASTLATAKFSAAQIANGIMLNESETNIYTAYVFAVLYGESACATAIKASSTNVASAIATASALCNPSSLTVNPVFTSTTCTYGSATSAATACATLADLF